MVLREVEETSPGIYKITPDNGSTFSLRVRYLSGVGEERLVPVGVPFAEGDTLFLPVEGLEPGNAGVLDEDESADVLHAALVFSCECAAMNYLSRAEQCRSGLLKKLLSKGMEKECVDIALDYLEEVNYLSDGRFASAWLRTRSIDHAEGRRKLSAELSSRGISRDIAKHALDEFFSEHSEREVCERALRKIRRTRRNLDEQKVYASLSRSGFPSRMIRSVLEDEQESPQ